jgi:hypothetical protein
MTILKIKQDVHNLAELQRRKAELKAKIDQETTELKATLELVKEDLKPANFVKSAFFSLIGMDGKNKTEQAPASPGNEHPIKRLGRSLPVQLITNLLIRDPRLKLLLQYAAPVAIEMGPDLWEKASNSIPSRKSMVHSMRQRLAKLRNRLPHNDHPNTLPDNLPEPDTQSLNAGQSNDQP